MPKRDLANSNHSASELIVERGEKVQKEYVLNNIPQEFSKCHLEKRIWIHDLEFYYDTYNCIGLLGDEIIIGKNMNFSKVIRKIYRGIVDLTNKQSGGIGFIDFERFLSQFINEESDKEILEELSEFFKDLNLYVRKGCEKPYVTFNFGLDTSSKGRRLSKLILEAFMKGDDNENPFIFPNLVFKVKDGINKKEGDENYDIFNLACKVTSKCMIPTYFNCDSTINKNFDSKKIGIMGCRSRVVENIHGDDGSIRRGNVACTTINLVKLALESERDIDNFKEKVLDTIEIAKDSLIERFKKLCEYGNLDFLRENNIYLDSNNTNYNMLKNGTLSIGFIGLFDAISVLQDKELSKEDVINNTLGYEILEMMSEKVKDYKEIYNLNFSLLASAAEGVSGKFPKEDRKKFKNKLTEKDYYTNSFHVPVTIKINYFEKIRVEGKFHKLCSGGSITYIELNEIPNGNIDGVREIIIYALDNDCNYIGINFPLDKCLDCKLEKEIGEFCPRCKSLNILRLRRVSGYLAETKNFSEGKKAELKDRKSHLI